MKASALFIALALPVSVTAGTLSFESSGAKVLDIAVPASTGLNSVYVADGMNGVRAVYTADSPTATVTWYRYSNLGGAYAETVNGVAHNGSTWTLNSVEGDMGYIIEEGTDRTYLWVVDYSRHALQLDALALGADSDCDFTSLALTGKADAIPYYTINGRQMTLSRELKVSYHNLEWNEEQEQFAQVFAEEELEAANAELRVPAALCATDFTLEGDRFLTAWGRPQKITSPSYDPIAVDAHTSAERINEKADNQAGGSDDPLGGSAPAGIRFKATVTDAALFTEWQFSTYPEFDDIQLRVSETEYTHTFDELGTTYVRFVCDNAAGTCQHTSETYRIDIGESSLLCPNAFSPGASEGVNDEWRVSYKSIVSFECHIFNRWGQKMATLTDPSQGWDGKYGGKLVPAGVYYYVIKARGADGRKYDLSGDINIIDYK